MKLPRPDPRDMPGLAESLWPLLSIFSTSLATCGKFAIIQTSHLTPRESRSVVPPTPFPFVMKDHQNMGS